MWLRPEQASRRCKRLQYSLRVILRYRPPAAIKSASRDSGHWPGSPSDARQMMMADYRLAMRKDTSRLYDIRRRSILELAAPTMPAAEARA